MKAASLKSVQGRGENLASDFAYLPEKTIEFKNRVSLSSGCYFRQLTNFAFAKISFSSASGANFKRERDAA